MHSCTCWETLFTSLLETPAHAAGILNCNTDLHFRLLGWIVLAGTCKTFSYISRASRSLAKTGLCWSPVFSICQGSILIFAYTSGCSFATDAHVGVGRVSGTPHGRFWSPSECFFDDFRSTQLLKIHAPVQTRTQILKIQSFHSWMGS